MKYLLLLFIFSSFHCFGQKKFVLTSDSVSVSYLMKEDSLSVLEKVQIQNLSPQAIYIPEIQRRDIYFFILNNTLYSFSGVMASLLGPPNLSLEVRLIKILPKESFTFSLNIPKGNNEIFNYYFSFDYLKSSGSNIDKGSILTISMDKYITLYKYAIGQIEGK
jgi:hypothetical protein